MAEPDSASNDTTTRPRSTGQSTTNISGGSPTSGNPERGWDLVKSHILSHKIDFILAVTRAMTVLCTLSYLIGFPGPASNRFKQALLMNAATSSLRLHQRMPPPQLNQINRTFFMNLIREDSFHYLIFPFMFFTGHPMALVLLPCALYATFNLAVYAITILDLLGTHELLKREISNFVTKYQQSLLHTIALAELSLMPVLVIGVLSRVIYFLVPIFYYRFLHLRYNSTRNAHLKLLVSQVRTVATSFMSRLTSR